MTGEALHLGGTAIKPVERKGLEGIKYFIYNPDTGEWFTRTPKSWFLITVFYIIFYTCLAAFWYGLLMAFFTTISPDRPKWTLDESLIGTSPGLGLRPQQPDSHIDSSIVYLVKNDKSGVPSSDFQTDSNADWAKRAEKFLEQYDNKTNTQACEEGTPTEDSNKACAFDKTTFDKCSEYPYGYQISEGEELVSPCLFIKPNRIYNWSPTPFEPEEIEALEAPENVKALLRQNPNRLYVNCLGENPLDREGLEGNIDYYPDHQGFDFKYFPYVQVASNYHNPALAIKIKNIEPGRLYHIECLLWGKGIVHSRKEKTGLVRFEVLIE